MILKIVIVLYIIWLLIAIFYHIYSGHKSKNCYFKHDWKERSSKWVKGYDIGFGITNSFRMYKYKCNKCGKEITTHYEL